VDVRDLEFLVASVGAGNFGRAAAELGLTTSTISRRIGRLEDELGLALFERGHAGVRLTAGGRAVLIHVRRALAELDAVRQAGLDGGLGETGEVRLGVWLPPVGEPLRGLLAAWRAQHPKVALRVSEMGSRDLAAALYERRLDVALTASHSLPPHLASLPMRRDPLMAALPSGHTLACRPSIDWPAVRHEIILIEGAEDGRAARDFLTSFLGNDVRFQSHAASKQSMFGLVSAGFGVALVPASQCLVPFPGVVFKNIDDPNAAVETVLAWLPALEDAAVGRFVAFMRDEARSWCPP